MKTIMEKLETIISIIEVWPDSELVNAWNLLCDNTGKKDERIKKMESFNEMFQHLSPLEVLEMVRGCKFGTRDDYFAFDQDGNIESFSEIADYSCFSYYELAEYLVDNGDGLARDVDTDELLESFILEYFSNYSFSQIKNTIEVYMENNAFDLLMDDWDVLSEDIRHYIEENGLVDDEDDAISDEDVANFVKGLLEEDDEDANWFDNKHPQEDEGDEN